MTILNRLAAALSSELRDEIKRLEQQLASEQRAASEQTELLMAVVEAAPVALVVLTEHGVIRYTNHAARELFFDGEAAEGQNFLQLLARASEPLRKALLSDEDHIFSFDHAGEIETYQLAKRHFALAGQLHSMLTVRNLTIELSQKENAVLRKAIRVIHHEFANSLAPVISLLRSARSKLDRPDILPKLDQMLAVVEDRVTHLNGFLSGFAALGRLPEPRRQAVPWQAFLAQLEPLLGEITVREAPAGQGYFDPAQLQQVLINLVKNAREAGSPDAEIVLEVLAAAEGGYRASVSDRGQGMNDDALEHAAVPSFTTKPNGSGMGLTLSREIVAAHRGRMRIARREGGGISVSLWLPAREQRGQLGVASRVRLSLTHS